MSSDTTSQAHFIRTDDDPTPARLVARHAAVTLEAVVAARQAAEWVAELLGADPSLRPPSLMVPAVRKAVAQQSPSGAGALSLLIEAAQQALASARAAYQVADAAYLAAARAADQADR